MRNVRPYTVMRMCIHELHCERSFDGWMRESFDLDDDGIGKTLVGLSPKQLVSLTELFWHEVKK